MHGCVAFSSLGATQAAKTRLALHDFHFAVLARLFADKLLAVAKSGRVDSIASSNRRIETIDDRVEIADEGMPVVRDAATGCRAWSVPGRSGPMTATEQRIMQYLLSRLSRARMPGLPERVRAGNLVGAIIHPRNLCVKRSFVTDEPIRMQVHDSVDVAFCACCVATIHAECGFHEHNKNYRNVRSLTTNEVCHFPMAYRG